MGLVSATPPPWLLRLGVPVAVVVWVWLGAGPARDLLSLPLRLALRLALRLGLVLVLLLVLLLVLMLGLTDRLPDRLREPDADADADRPSGTTHNPGGVPGGGPTALPRPRAAPATVTTNGPGGSTGPHTAVTHQVGPLPWLLRVLPLVTVAVRLRGPPPGTPNTGTNTLGATPGVPNTSNSDTPFVDRPGAPPQTHTKSARRVPPLWLLAGVQVPLGPSTLMVATGQARNGMTANGVVAPCVPRTTKLESELELALELESEAESPFPFPPPTSNTKSSQSPGNTSMVEAHTPGTSCTTNTCGGPASAWGLLSLSASRHTR